MPRFPGFLFALAASWLVCLPFGSGHAATQALALLETDSATALVCRSGVCKAEFSTFCLQKERDLPHGGDPYRVADAEGVTLILTRADGTTSRIPAAEHIRIEAARSGHTAVTMEIDRATLADLGATHAAIEVGKRVALMPTPVSGDDNPQTVQDQRIATGPLRDLGAKIVDKGPHDVARVHVLNRLINILPGSIDRRPNAQQSLWREAADSAFGGEPAERKVTARQEYTACWRDRIVSLFGDSVRNCLQRRHDDLMWQHVKRYWSAVGAGS